MIHRPVLALATAAMVALSGASAREPLRASTGPQAQQTPSAATGQTPTRLADGRWLVVGGGGGASAAIWDPATKQFTPVATGLITPRVGQSATLLSDGTVLIAGGRNAQGLVATAELFDPATNGFVQLSIADAAPRSAHTATLLTDGRVLVAGGVGAGGGPLPPEIWDVAAQTAVTIGVTPIDRTGHTATLTPDGKVRLADGKSIDGQNAAAAVLVDPANGSVVPESTDARDDVTPALLTGSIPVAASKDVPTDAHVALRFSHSIAADSLTSDTVTLIGPDGPVTSAIVAAEDGRLAFLWPSGALAEGATYRIELAGATDATGRPVSSASFEFTTKESDRGNEPIEDPESWTPNPADPAHGWTSNRPPSPWESLPPLLGLPGTTAVSGRVLRLDGRPLPDVTLEIEGHEAHTDRTGRFLIAIGAWTTRKATLEIDARTANKPNRTYGFYEARVGIVAGQTNVLPFTIWSPLIDTAHQVTIPSPTTRETVILAATCGA